LSIDMVIRNGRLFDPALGLDAIGDLGIKKRTIAWTNKPVVEKGKVEINATGCLVLPGIIDVHSHCFWRGNYIGMPADLAGIPSGVTATIDAGSSGVSNYMGLLRLLDQCETKTKIMLHLSAGGQMMSRQFPENIDPSVWDMSLFEKAFELCNDRIVGLKMRVSKSVLGDLGLRPFEEGLKMAARFNTRLFIHPTDPIIPMGELAAMLRPGDVMCHMYQGFGDTLIVDGGVDGKILDARKRGVIFDVSQGQGNFSLVVAKQAIEQGFLPDTISTDLNMENWNHPFVFSLPMVMTKHLALGMSLEQVVAAVTANAAKQMGAAGNMGTLQENTCADISIFKLVDAPVMYRDVHGNTLQGDKMLTPMATIIDGTVLYRSPSTL